VRERFFGFSRFVFYARIGAGKNRQININVMLTNKTKTLLTIALLCLGFFWSGEAQADVIFQDDFDTPAELTTCADGLRTGYTNSAACDSSTYDSATYYCAEISTGGRSGSSLKFWRRNGIWGNTSWSTPADCGGWGKYFTETEFNNHYKELFIRWYVKIPPDWNAYLAAGGNSFKLNRILFGSSPLEAKTWFMNINGDTFKEGNFMFYNASMGGVYYTTKTVSELGVNDGKWHSLEWHLKLNSTTGSTDGGWAFYVDGEEVQIDTLSGPSYGVWGVNTGALTDDYFTSCLPPGIGNIVGGYWTFPTDGWYAFEFDDYVVSTSYIGPIEESISPIPGDINKDGIVNIFDYNILLQNFGATNDCQNSADLNGDCAVNIFDYNILLQNFGRTE
jgi:hypothetical protein